MKYTHRIEMFLTTAHETTAAQKFRYHCWVSENNHKHIQNENDENQTKNKIKQHEQTHNVPLSLYIYIYIYSSLY